jgi:hypothetical protein
MPTSRELLLAMALRLEPLLPEIVFLGGCATVLLATDTGASPTRVTYDVDIIVEVGSRAEYYRFSERLRKLGFSEDATEGAPICRWTHESMTLDLMPIDARILGFSNRWYEDAFTFADRVSLGELELRVVTAPHFIATKLKAFKGRGNGDLFASRDLEDIVSALDGRPSLIEEVERSEPRLQEYLADEFTRLVGSPGFIDAVSGHMPGDEISQARVPKILERIARLQAKLQQRTS